MGSIGEREDDARLIPCAVSRSRHRAARVGAAVSFFRVVTHCCSSLPVGLPARPRGFSRRLLPIRDKGAGGSEKRPRFRFTAEVGRAPTRTRKRHGVGRVARRARPVLSHSFDALPRLTLKAGSMAGVSLSDRPYAAIGNSSPAVSGGTGKPNFCSGR